MILLAGLLVAAAALYPLSHLGFRDALQALLQSFDIAVEQYARVAGTHWYDLELTATDNPSAARCRRRTERWTLQKVSNPANRWIPQA